MEAVRSSAVLLALADPKRRAALQQTLAATGLPVTAPAAGPEARRLAAGGTFRCLVLDPAMSGLDPAAVLREKRRDDGVAAILLAGASGVPPAGADLVLPADLPDPSLVAVITCLLAWGQRLAGARETAVQLRQVFEEAKQNLQRLESEQQQDERRLRALRQRFHRLIDANPAVIYATEAGEPHRCLFVSRRLRGLLGWEPSQMVGSGDFWLEHIHPEDRERVLAEIESHLRAGHGSLRYRFRHADGSWRWLRDDFAMLRDSDGRALEIIGCWSDISTEKAAVARFEAIFRAVPDGVLLSDGNGIILQANPALARIFGYANPGELEGQPLTGLIPEAQREAHAGHMAGYLRHPSARPMGRALPLEGLRADGSLVPLDIALTPFADPSGGPDQVLATVRDISEQRAQAGRIEDLLRAYAMLSGVNQAVVGIGEEGELLQAVCRIAVAQGGYRLAWVGRLDAQGHWLEPVASAGETGYLEGIRVSARAQDPEGQGPSGQVLRGGEAVVCEDLEGDQRFAPWREAARRHGLKALAALPLMVEGRTIGSLNLYSDRPQHFSGEELALLAEMAGDLGFGIERIGHEARRRKAEAHIASLAYHDEATGLYNRAGFLQAVTEALAGDQALALAVFDLARLREVNLSLGYDLGDALLREVSRRLSGDAEERLLAHLGASVFALVLPGVRTEGDAAGRLEALLGMLERPFGLDGVQVAVQYHAGLALAPRDGREAGTLLRRADLAKETAKTGAGIGRFRPGMEPDPGEQALLARLVLALDSDQFRLHFQPKMDLRSGRITAVEALVRWQDPDAGLQPPGRFIPLLEKTGLMTRLTPRLLAAAAAARARWLARGLDIRMAVNIAAADLADRGLPEVVRDACSSAGIREEGMLLELTETAVLQESPVVTENLAALARLGVKLSIDDFGTGHASLSRLVELPVSQIKIDQGFVTSMLASIDKHTIVEAAIFLGRRLDLEVVAEGIEDVATLALIREMGCDKAQGYVICRPLPEDELLTWLAGRVGGG